MDGNIAAASSVGSGWKTSGQGATKNQYGSTFKERVSNSDLWIDFLLSRGGFAPNPNCIQLGMDDNPISFLIPFEQFTKASLGLKTLGGASKTTLVTTTFFKEVGVSGSLGGKWITPLGSASNWETFFGRWTPFIMDSGLIYDYTTKNDNK